eukprot:1153963-Pelagomonas_calceolata.AAC.5
MGKVGGISCGNGRECNPPDFASRPRVPELDHCLPRHFDTTLIGMTEGTHLPCITQLQSAGTRPRTFAAMSKPL